MHQNELPRLVVPPGQEDTHELYIKYYDEQETIIEDEIIRCRADQRWDGARRSYYRSGAMSFEEVWCGGLLWETLKALLPDGSPAPGSDVTDGDGYRRIFSGDGRPKFEGPYLGGRRNGAWTRYHEDGTRGFVEYYNDYEEGSYCDPELILSVLHRGAAPSMQAREMLALCEGSLSSLLKALARLISWRRIAEHPAPVFVELLSMPCSDYSLIFEHAPHTKLPKRSTTSP